MSQTDLPDQPHKPDLPHLMAVCEVTWPAAEEITQGPLTLRRGLGGGSRVSSARLSGAGPLPAADLAAAETAMQQMGQKRIFQVTPDQPGFDAQLDAAGYRLFDPVILFAAPIAPLAGREIPRVCAFAVWEPLAIQIDIWERAGIGAARLAVMQRATCPKTSILGRLNDSPAGTAYAGLHDGTVMVHALEVLEHQRRQGMAGHAMARAAKWGAEQGATHIAVIVRAANAGAVATYRALGLEEAGRYHYRIHPGDAENQGA